MLVAVLADKPVEAAGAEPRLDYRCPQCNGRLILKRGRIIVSHFAHKSPIDCGWPTGETIAHLESKKFIRDTLLERGLDAQVEFIVDTMPGDRRADVMTWRSDEQRVAFELQHTPISLDEIESRSLSYARIDIAQIWIPFLRASVWERAEKANNGYNVPRYAARPFEKWVLGLNSGDGMWMYDPQSKMLWHAFLIVHEIYVKESTWYSEDGEEHTSGGFYRDSKRYSDLRLIGPHQFADLRIVLKSRERARSDIYNWPKGKIAFLKLQTSLAA